MCLFPVFNLCNWTWQSMGNPPPPFQHQITHPPFHAYWNWKHLSVSIYSLFCFHFWETETCFHFQSMVFRNKNVFPFPNGVPGNANVFPFMFENHSNGNYSWKLHLESTTVTLLRLYMHKHFFHDSLLCQRNPVCRYLWLSSAHTTCSVCCYFGLASRVSMVKGVSSMSGRFIVKESFHKITPYFMFHLH